MFGLAQRQRIIFFLCLVVGVVLIAVILASAPDQIAQVNPDESPDRKLVRYSFTLVNQSDETVENVVFRAFAPVEQTHYQRVDLIQSSENFQLRSDALGNQELEYLIESLPPYGQKVITVSVELSVWSIPRNIKGEPFLSLLRQEGLVPLVDEAHVGVEGALADVRGLTILDEPIDWMRTANAWVHQSLEDVGYVSRDRGALFALTERKGDCTEFMHALVALARVQKIPTMPVAGFRIDGSGAILKAMDYHNWVMFEADGKWRVADPHTDVFERQQDAYVVFRLLPANAGPGENSQRFFVHDPRVTVSMN